MSSTSSFAVGIALEYWSAHSLFRIKLSVGVDVMLRK